MAKILVTGATGFIGSHLTERLVEADNDVTCLVRKTSNLKWIKGLNVKLIYADCSDKESLEGVLGKFDYIYHTAGITKALSRDEYLRANYHATQNMIDTVARKNKGIKKFVYISSLSACGPGTNSKPLTEDEDPHPITDYGESKLLGEKAVKSWEDKLPVVIIRPSAVYGPRDRDIYFFFKLAKLGIIFIWGETYLSLCHVADLVEAIILAAENNKSSGIYFVSDGMAYSSIVVADKIAEAVGRNPLKVRVSKGLLYRIASIYEQWYRISQKPALINRGKVREMIQPYWICDISRARAELNYTPSVSLKEGIRMTAEWYIKNGWL